MAEPLGKRWVIQSGESVEVDANGRVYRQLFLRWTKTGADPFWIFQDQDGQTLYLEEIKSIRRTNMPNRIPPPETDTR